MEDSKHECKVCQKFYKLVGKKRRVLDNHGDKVDVYGQSPPCRGSGLTPDDSLTGAIRFAKRSIEHDTKQRDLLLGHGEAIEAEWYNIRTIDGEKIIAELESRL